MKFSRKVGRRSRFSVSRRRLRNKKSRSGYRKKHTQRGGKQGRGHKRMRARTHKRGKRFHRGGDVITTGQGIENAFMEYSDNYESKIIDKETRSFCVGKKNNVVMFKVKKEGTFSTTEPQKFYCVLKYTIKKDGDDYNVRSFLLLTRFDNSGIVFSVDGDSKMHSSTLPDSAINQEILAEKLKSKNFLEKMKSMKNILYDFSDPANKSIFDKLAEIFENKDYTSSVLAKFKSIIESSPPAPESEATLALKQQQKEYNELLTQEKEKIKQQVKILGDNLEVTFEGQQSAVKFSDFKSELMQIAKSSIQKINDNSELTNRNKNECKDFIKFLLLQILLAQYKIMKRTYLLIKLKKLNDTNYSPLYHKLKGEDNIDENAFMSLNIRNLLKKTNEVKEIIESVGNLTYDYRENYFKDKDKLNTFSDNLLYDDYLDTEQKRKLEQELEQEPEQISRQNDDDLLSSAAPVAPAPVAPAPAPEDQEITASE
jgi:hypothetical protein